MKNYIKHFLTIAVIGLFCLNSCNSEQTVSKSEISIDLTQKGTYEMTFDLQESPYIIAYVIISDNKGKDRPFGETIKDTLIRFQLTLKKTNGEIVFQQKFGSKEIIIGNWNLPSTTLVFDPHFEDNYHKNEKKFIAVLDIIQPSEYFGKHSTKFIIDPPEKYK